MNQLKPTAPPAAAQGQLSLICDAMAGWLAEARPQNPNWPDEMWAQFQIACRVHGTAPLLSQKLAGVDWLAEPTRAWLAEQYKFNVERLSKMQAELKTILACFKRHEVAVMPLKGSVLAAAYYPQAAWRPMADLDLLIRPADFGRATALLRQLGYEQEVAHWKHTQFIKPDNRQVVSRQVEHPDNPRGLEVHLYCRETFGGPSVDLTALMWQQATTGHLLGQETWLAAAQTLWLHLLVHASYHMWQGRGRLIHLVDLSLLTPQLNDPRPFLAAIDARYTYPSLALLGRYFPAAVDKALLEEQQQRLSTSFRAWVASLNLVNTSYLQGKPNGPYLLKALKFAEKRPQEVMQALRFAFLPSLAEIALDHPRLATSPAPWLGYLLLPVDWIKRWLRLAR